MNSAGIPNDFDAIIAGEPGSREASPGDALLAILGDHPLVEVADGLSRYLEIGVDVVSLLMFLSRAAGRLGLPFNLEVCSDDPGAEHQIADRLIHIVPENVRRTETIKQFRDLAETDFADTELVVVRSRHDSLFHFACESTCRDVAAYSPPAVWLISDARAASPPFGPTLSLLAKQIGRSLSGFGHHFSRLPPSDQNSHREQLRRWLLPLKCRRNVRCPFQQRIRAALRPSEMTLFNRLLLTVAALRIEVTHGHGRVVPDAQMQASVDDYRVARDLLLALPIPGQHSSLSPHAAATAELLYEEIVGNPEYQLTLPDHSGFGKKGFTRLVAQDVTGLSYNAVKEHLSQLEDEGVLESLTVSGHGRQARIRRQGVQIYFRFDKSRSPPFGVSNPFSNLPTEKEIAADCSNDLQSEPPVGS